MALCRLRDGRRLLVEEAKPDKAAQVLQFLRLAVGQTDYLVSTPEDFAQMTVEAEREYLASQAARPDAATLCGLLGKQPVAIASFEAAPRARAAHTAEVSIVVDRSVWRCGVGSAMMRQLVLRAQNAGTIRLLHLGVRADNAAAIAMYRQQGFAQSGRLPNYMQIDGMYYDMLTMVREL